MQKIPPLNKVSNAALQAPTPVKELLLNWPIPQHTEQEKEEVPPIQKQSKINFISDEDVPYFVQQKENEQELTKLQYQTND